MEIKEKKISTVSLSGYGFPEFEIVIIPQKSGCHDCYLHAPEYGKFVRMFGLEEDAGRCAELAYAAVPEYIGDLVLLCP